MKNQLRTGYRTGQLTTHLRPLEKLPAKVSFDGNPDHVVDDVAPLEIKDPQTEQWHELVLGVDEIDIDGHKQKVMRGVLAPSGRDIGLEAIANRAGLLLEDEPAPRGIGELLIQRTISAGELVTIDGTTHEVRPANVTVKMTPKEDAIERIPLDDSPVGAPSKKERRKALKELEPANGIAQVVKTIITDDLKK